MKRLLPLLLFLMLFTGCRKNNGYEDTGTIIGFDYRKCKCCGGWFIAINQDTLRFLNLPEGSTLNLEDAIFPMDVYLDWHYPDPQCMSDEIVVERMEIKK